MTEFCGTCSLVIGGTCSSRLNSCCWRCIGIHRGRHLCICSMRMLMLMLMVSIGICVTIVSCQSVWNHLG